MMRKPARPPPAILTADASTSDRVVWGCVSCDRETVTHVPPNGMRKDAHQINILLCRDRMNTPSRYLILLVHSAYPSLL